MAIIKRKYRTKKHQKPVIFYQAEVFVKGVRVSMKSFSTRKDAIFWHEQERHKFSFSPTSLNDRMSFKGNDDRSQNTEISQKLNKNPLLQPTDNR